MINWGIIGCGNVTEVKSGPAFSKVAGSKLLAVMRRDAGLAADYARRHNVPRYYSDADRLINDPDINAVYVATPPASHAEYALRVLRAGKPVYIEKPMAMNHAECMEVNRAGEKYGLPVFVAYYRRTLPGFLLIRDLIRSGSIGKPRHIQLQIINSPTEAEKSGNLPWRVIPSVAGAGHFFDLASHQLDYLDFLFGPVRKVSSVAVNQAGLYEAEDMVAASFLFDENIVATGEWCFSASPESNRDSFEITGDKGLIRTSTFSFEPIVLINGDGRQEFRNEKPDNVQYFLIDQVVRSLNGEGNEVVSTGVSAARTSRVMDQVVREYYMKRSGGEKHE